ncbi:hypothetical protein ACFOY2_40025 [Nonomuraea purpurea]|uniref:Serine/threonine protein kinase n=1 Tax=Nonomuraea purpurea TaxID=1849276 RepID=A0ABV8GHQ2_9ACTN
MEFQGWGGGLALRPRDYLGTGEPLAAVVGTAGPFRGQTLHLLALGTAATLARLHLGGIAGLRLNPGNVMIGPHGQAFFAPGPRTSEFPAQDVRDWAEVIVFAATGRPADEEPDLDRLLPALRAVVEECRRPDAAARPTAVDLVRILLGHSGAAPGASVAELLREAENRTRPYEEQAPYEAVPAPTPIWRRPAYLAGVAIGVLAVTVATAAVAMIAREPEARDVVSAIGHRTASFQQKGDSFAADGRLSFDAGVPATSYEMTVTCGQGHVPVPVTLVGSKGVAAGVPFDADRPQIEPCASFTAPSIRRYSSPNTIKALLEAAEPGLTTTSGPGNGRTITGTAMAHRLRGVETGGVYGGGMGEGPVRFELRVDGRGLPTRLALQTDSRSGGRTDVETVYQDWRAFEAVGTEVRNG